MKKANWTSHLIHVEYEGNVISVGNDGIYEIDSNYGSWKTMQKGWPGSLAMCRIGDFAYVAKSNGIYRLNLANSCSYTKINEEDWSKTKAMVAWNGNMYIFCQESMYIMDQEGTYKSIGKRGWEDLVGVVNIGSNCYVHYPDCVYYVDLHDTYLVYRISDEALNNKSLDGTKKTMGMFAGQIQSGE